MSILYLELKNLGWRRKNLLSKLPHLLGDPNAWPPECIQLFYWFIFSFISPDYFLSDVHESFSKFHLRFLFFSHAHYIYVYLFLLSVVPNITWKVTKLQILFVILSHHLSAVLSFKTPRISQTLQHANWLLRKTICLANTGLEKSLLSIQPSRFPLLLDITCQTQEVSMVLVVFWSCWSFRSKCSSIHFPPRESRFITSGRAQEFSLLGSLLWLPRLELVTPPSFVSLY